ncbi:MAG: hypothetical protein GWN55_08635 [Phycisphaerae bacterium]|nr:hypothetical protein [candidate division KSB1 bacterium]NIV01369.1 hypothetical protein [Phycisphaerae bacterium]NIW70631.1 hypothetical protein [candidate division KSB1 bacterium]
MIWQTVVKERPQNPQYRTSLAAAYLNVGRREEAIAQLEKAAELNERFRDQAEYYIREIRAGRNP